jgi:hypothetical protein
MTISSTALSADNIVKPKNSIGETCARKVFSDWNGAHVADACIAATQIGLLHSGGLLGYYRAKELLKDGFEAQAIDDIHWSTVNDAFQIGRCAVINPTQLRERFYPAAANDNKPKQSPRWVAFQNMLKERAGTSVEDAIANRSKDRFQITWFDDVDQSTAKEEIVQGVLGAGEFSLFVAKPGTAKSVLVGDIGCHIAAGIDWHGRKVKQGLVVFFAAERKKLTERRVAAWRKKHGVSGIPFVVVGGKLDLTSGVIDAKALATTIKTLEEKSGHECVLIILDTVTRTFGPGDQHQSRDMQRYVQSVDELNRATNAHVAAIHHSGWEGDRGKGAIDLDGAIDASFVVDVKGTGPAKVFTLACIGANDGEEGVVTSFQLESVALGTDADGKVTTAPVVVQADAVTPFDGSNLKGNSAKAFESLERAIEAHGECPPDGSPGFPDGVATATREAWRNRYYADAMAKETVSDDTLGKRFRRAIEQLTEAGKISSCGPMVLAVGQPDMSGH